MEFNCFEIIYFIIGQTLLQTGAIITKWATLLQIWTGITASGLRYYNVWLLCVMTKWGR